MEIKLLEEDDWQFFRDIRLEALQNSTVNFSSTYELESFYDEEKWREII